MDTDYWFTHLQNVDFQSIFARSSSAITPGKNGSIDATRKSTARFQMSLGWTSYVAPKPLKGGSKTQGVQNMNNKLW